MNGNKFDEAAYYGRYADAILEAYVESLEPELDIRDEGHERYRVFRLRVLRLYKGEAAAVAVIRSRESHACGYPFEVGRQYLIYAQENDDGNLVAELQKGTKPLIEAASDIRYFRDEPPLPEDQVTYDWDEDLKLRYPEWAGSSAEVCGRVLNPTGQPVSKGAVYAWSVREDGKNPPPRTGRIKSDGSYEIHLLIAGRYYFGAASSTENASARHVGFYKENSTQEEPSVIELKARERRCGMDILTASEPLHTIEGAVRAARDEPIPPRGVQVALESEPGTHFRFGQMVRVKDDGTFAIPNVPPGRYRVRAFLSARNDRHWSIKWVSIKVPENISDVHIPIARKTTNAP
ncbi:MAG: hypothetical protein ACRD5I_09050 [Candidatus Acidiferrales bacterium]